VGLVDVLRAAVSEIEQYERVSLTVQPGIAVRGQAVNDVVHLLAELAENATSFSAAETPVAVSGHLLNSGGVLLEITDQGVGMGAEEMAHANWRLDNPPVVDVAVSRRMGLFVVARLAARHGIRVRLRPASMGGLTALVWLPDEVISHETAGVPAGLRRFETASTAAASSPADLAVPSPSAGAATAPALENGHLPVLGAPAGASATADQDLAPGAAMMPSLASALSPDVVMPPVPSAAEESRLPIFESVESDWFRRSRHGVERPATAAPTETAAAPAETAGAPAETAAAPAEAWSSPADEGWRAAEVAQAPVSGGTTAAGLPVRVPQANLVPGTVSSTATAPSPSPPAPARSATRAQERLASFQRGVRSARAAAQGTNGEGTNGEGTNGEGTNGAGSGGESGEEGGDVTREADLSSRLSYVCWLPSDLPRDWVRARRCSPRRTRSSDGYRGRSVLLTWLPCRLTRPSCGRRTRIATASWMRCGSLAVTVGSAPRNSTPGWRARFRPGRSASWPSSPPTCR
jgi:hypothetical protein